MQHAWRPVYRGQDERHAAIAADFLATYKDYLFHGEEAQLKPITGARLLEELRSSAATAASWDQWAHGEWRVGSNAAGSRGMACQTVAAHRRRS